MNTEISEDRGIHPSCAIPAVQIHAHELVYAGFSHHGNPKTEIFGWHVPVRPYGEPICEIRITLRVKDVSGIRENWVTFVVNTKSKVTVIPRTCLTGNVFKGPCYESEIPGSEHGFPVRYYGASVMFGSPHIDEPMFAVNNLNISVADNWPEEFGHLGMDVLERVVMVSDGRYFSFWPRSE